MGLFDGIMGNAAELSVEEIEAELKPMLIESEVLEKAFKVLRDMYVFTNYRIISIDKQGISGKKVEFLSIPYDSIHQFSTENAGGFMDRDGELKLWVSGRHDPLRIDFKKNVDINEIYMLLSRHILLRNKNH